MANPASTDGRFPARGGSTAVAAAARHQRVSGRPEAGWKVARPPRALIGAAGAAWLLAVALMFAPTLSLPAHIPGYLLSAPSVFGLVAAFRRIDLGRRGTTYVPARWWSRAGTALLVLSLVPTGWHAWMIATVLAS